MMRSKFLTLLCFLCVFAWDVPRRGIARADSKSNFPATYTGHYGVIVRGFWTGEGDATLGANSIRITATVKDDSGRSGQLIFSNLNLANGYFTGTGTFMGIPVRIDGRVDPADADRGHGRHDVVNNACFSATLAGAGHAGRVVGNRDK